MIVRGLYRCLLLLHPAAFRRQFAAEMLWIFDEAAGTCGAAFLCADAGMSLLRQWLLRSELWIGVVAVLGGAVSLLIAFGSFIPWDSVWRALRSAF
jgi:hypothetical protein